ncbi:dihydrodipicolinate synthase family protein [Phytoactinopolyspora limicola]|uniref:dihydrodipicolinate synthase family protein n=1 Tax=Phytoactinopolyspora limicola TaxID=2715536 RepID=UPI0014080E23|nr:dihydrodipicolinate synthase family protein [Phytoactinopolyspora limicola]
MKGIFPALISGYKDDGEIDVAGTLKLVDRLLGAGVHGLFVGGTAGEGVVQSVAERKALLDATIGHVAAEVPVIAHVGTLATRTTVELAKHAYAAGAQAVAAVAPFYYDIPDDAMADHYRAVAAAVDVPLYGYHIPSLTGRDLDPKWLLTLADEGVLAGLKFSSKDLGAMGRIAEHTPDHFLIYNGMDDVLLGGLLYGAVGGVGSTYNVMPELYVELYRAIQEGRVDDARALQRQATAFIERLERYDFLAFLREILRLQGLDIGTSRMPLPSLDDRDRTEIERCYRDDPTFHPVR